MPLTVLRARWVLSSIVVSVALATFLSGAVLAVGRDKAMYVRGTLSAIKERAEGRFNTQPEAELAFSAGKKGSVAIPYAAIASLEFEEKERVVVIIGFAPPVSKQLFYYLTITYSDPEGKEQSGVFELGKDIVRTMLNILEVRSGKAITFQNAETCRQYKTAKECEGKYSIFDLRPSNGGMEPVSDRNCRTSVADAVEPATCHKSAIHTETA